MARQKPLRWRKVKRGRTAGPTICELVRDGMVYAIAQHQGGDLWFWYAPGPVNTSRRPAPLEDVKAEALRHVQTSKQARPFR